jgi:hypothetical protein
MIDRSARGEDYLGEMCSKYCGLYNHMDCDNCKSNNKYTRQILEESDKLVKFDRNTIEEITTIVEDRKLNQAYPNVIGRYLLENSSIETENDEFGKICEDLANLILDKINADIDIFLKEVISEQDYQTNRLCSSRASKDMCKECEQDCVFRKSANRQEGADNA